MPRITTECWNSAALRLAALLPDDTDDHLALGICATRAAGEA